MPADLVPVPALPSGKDAGPVPAWGWLRERRHWTVPLAVPGVLWCTGLALHAAHAAPETACGAVVLSGAVWIFAPHKWRRKDGTPQKAEVLYARSSAVLGAGWLAGAAFTGPAGGTAGLSLLAAVAAGSGVWGVLWWRHKRPRGWRRRQKLIAACDAWWQSYAWKWQLAGSRVDDAWQTGTLALKMHVKGRPGVHSFKNVKSIEHLVDSALSGTAAPGMAWFEPDPKDGSCWFLHVKREDPLGAEVGWDPSLVPASVRDPAPVGMRETGGWLMADLRGGWFLNGRSRWGKSNQLSVLLATLTAVPDALVWLIDRKGGRSARPWLPAVDWLATTIEEARIMLAVAVDEIRARSELAGHEEEQLQPTPAIPAIFIVIDEAGQVTADAPNGDRQCQADAATIASMGQAIAVEIIAASQYGRLDTSVGTEQMRSNLWHRACFATEKPEHGVFALGDGAPDTSKIDRKGKFFYKAGPDRPAEAHRAPHMPHALVRQIAAVNGGFQASRPPVALFAAHRQDAYDGRWERLPESFRDGAPQYQAHVRDGQPARPDQAPPVPLPASVPGEGSAPAAAARIAAELDEVHGTGPSPDPTRTAGTGAALDNGRAAFCSALQGAHRGISPKELTAASGMSRSWVMARLKALSEAGAAVKSGTGLYVPAEGADIEMALDVADADGRRLLRQAAAISNAA